MQQLEPFACTRASSHLSLQDKGLVAASGVIVHKMRQLEPSPRRGQLQLRHLSLHRLYSLDASAKLSTVA
eukprot:2745269-Karenia_brevis.AAC.1